MITSLVPLPRHGLPLNLSFPELFSFALNKQISVKKALDCGDLTSLFQLPLSQTAFVQLMNVQQVVDNLVLSDDKDKWTFCWGSDYFVPSKVYRLLIGHSTLDPVYKWLWKSCCQPKHKVFFWLLLKDRLSTRNILRRRNLHLDSYTCVLCTSLAEETLEHLFLDCPFSAMCWNIINVVIPLQSTFPDIFSQIRDQLASPFAMNAIILISWAIWNVRNELIFSGVQISLANSKRIFFRELSLLQHRIKPALLPQFLAWILSTKASRQSTLGYTHGSSLSVDGAQTTNSMVTQDTDKLFIQVRPPNWRNTYVLRLVVLICVERSSVLGGPLAPPYIVWRAGLQI